MHKIFFSLFFLLAASEEADYNTFSNYREVRLRHLHLEWDIDLSSQRIFAIADYRFHTLAQQLNHIKLDVYQLKVDRVLWFGADTTFSTETITGQSLIQGDVLIVPFKYSKRKIIKLRIHYQIDSNARALSFLNPDQTDSKQAASYLYSLCQANNCRSIIPLPDTPSFKFTYSSTVLTRDPKIKVYMSGNPTSRCRRLLGSYSNYQNKFCFELKLPIPGYLISIVAGAIDEFHISNTASVVSEQSLLKSYAEELQDIEFYKQVLEDYIGPYKWGKLRIVVMPRSFPFGGMEHPLLIFVNPLNIVGDKRGALDVVVHEIAHSWAGNTVTCSNWANFWINEGFCVFLERKALSVIVGKDYSLMDSYIGEQNLKLEWSRLKRSKTRSYASLHPDLKNRNADDSYNAFPYEKGFQLLFYIEQKIGEENMKRMLQEWVKTYEFLQLSIEMDQKKYSWPVAESNRLVDNCSLQYLDIQGRLDLMSMIGLSPIKFDFSNSLSTNVLDEANLLKEGLNLQIGYASYMPIQKKLFLEILIGSYRDITTAAMQQLQEIYQMDQEHDMTIRQRWLLLSVLTQYSTSETNAELVRELLSKYGKWGIVAPFYYHLPFKLCQEYFAEFRNNYHPIVRQQIFEIIQERKSKDLFEND